LQNLEDAQQKLLVEVTKDQKLQKTETVDKSKLPSKSELAEIIKTEKEIQKLEDNHSKVLESVTKGEKKIKKSNNRR